MNPFGYIGALGYHTGAAKDDTYVRARNYVATAARWISKDPFLGDEASFDYVSNCPTIKVDPSGLLPVCGTPPQPNCCCCAEAIRIRNVKRIDDRTWWGTGFETVISLKRVASFWHGDCSLSWIETSSLEFLGVKPNVPVDQFKKHPTSETFRPWLFQKKPCPGSYTVVIYDPPSLRKKNVRGGRNTVDRTLHFMIEANSSLACPCKKKSVWLTAGQYLKVWFGNGWTEKFWTPDPPYRQ